MSTPILLVSGGAESVSIAIAEWAIAAGRRLIVYSLVGKSLIEGVRGVERTVYAPSADRAEVVEDLRGVIVRLYAATGAPLVAFPSEDDSLGLLLQLSTELGEQVLSCSRCRALPGGGLDKAELFSCLESAGLGAYIADTIAVRSEDDVSKARTVLGEDMVVKPSSKWWGANLQGGAKTHSGDELVAIAPAQERRRDFDVGRPWVAQRRLGALAGGERSACVVRDGSGALRYAEVVEWMKYPVRGGSACIVETQPDSLALHEATCKILSAVDAVGIVELSFLADEMGCPRLLELNVRPWLQIDLLQWAGFDLLGDAEDALRWKGIEAAEVRVRRATWVSVERILLKIARGDGGSRWKTFASALRALSKRPRVSTWSTRLPGVRWRWVLRNLRRVAR